MNGRYGEVSRFLYFLFFLSEEDIIGSQYWPEPSLSKFYKKKNLDKQSYCRNLPQSHSDHKLKLAAKYSFSFDYWLLDGHVCLWPATKYTKPRAGRALSSFIPEQRRLRWPWLRRAGKLSSGHLGQSTSWRENNQTISPNCPPETHVFSSRSRRKRCWNAFISNEV